MGGYLFLEGLRYGVAQRLRVDLCSGGSALEQLHVSVPTLASPIQSVGNAGWIWREGKITIHNSYQALACLNSI